VLVGAGTDAEAGRIAEEVRTEKEANELGERIEALALPVRAVRVERASRIWLFLMPEAPPPNSEW
jgi:hypothetical protein